MAIKRISDEISAVERRMLDRAEQINDPQDIVYQHTVLCQTVMPYRDPGSEIQVWERRQGEAHLRLEAGSVLDPETKQWMPVGLPFGPKPRLILYHLNSLAIRTQSRLVEVDDSLTAFVSRIGLSTSGRSINTVRDQLGRLATVQMQIAAVRAERVRMARGQIIEGLELWAPREPGQRTLWPTYVEFSDSYFQSLVKHAVPLNESAIGALSHSAMALDTYTWLAQRLHRVQKGGALVPWERLYEQFGQGFGRQRDFKRKFNTALKQVHAVYPAARFKLEEQGMTLYSSPPPIKRRLHLLG